MTLRRRLVLLVISLIIPSVLASAVAAYLAYSEERGRAERNLLSTARAVSLVIDHELDSAVRVLQALATSPSLTEGNLAAFRQQAIDAVTGEGRWVVLLDRDAHQLVNTLLPYGQPLPDHPFPQNVRRVIQTGKPEVSDLFIGPVSHRPTLAVDIPVVRDGKVVYDLAMGKLPSVLERLLQAQKLPATWTAAIFDRQGTIVARSHHSDAYLGKPVSQDVLEHLSVADEGVFSGINQTGAPRLAAYSRSPRYGWGFLIGIPRSEIFESVRMSILTVLGAGFGLLSIGLLLAVLVARGVARPITALIEPAVALGHGEAVAVAPCSGLLEVDAVGTALVAAGELVRRRSGERDRAEAALARTNETLESLVSARTRELQETNERLRVEITERHRAETELFQVGKLNAIGQLSSGVAHDFNNVLQGVGNCLAVLESRVEEPALKHLVATGARAVRRGATLTQQLLAFSRRQRLEPRPTDVTAVINGLIELLHCTLGGTVKVNVELTADLWPAVADRQQLELALINLAINGRDAMPEEGGTLTISTANIGPGEAGIVGFAPDACYVRIIVSDTGCGMTEDVLLRAFEPFFTTKELGKGTGLGLSTVYGLVRQLGGDVRLSSRSGEGTTVSIYLPRAEAGAEAMLHKPGAEVGVTAVQPVDTVGTSTLAPAANGADRTISLLVVDDDPLVRQGLVFALDGLGFAVQSVAGGPAALELLAGDVKVDVLLTDFAMPGMSGIELIDRVRVLRPEMPALIMTGYAEVAALDAGPAVEVLKKPFDITVLSDLIERVRLEGRESAAIVSNAAAV
ncbi:MAG: ATP-binding protein [Rhodospirillaceae bacterium]